MQSMECLIIQEVYTTTTHHRHYSLTWSVSCSASQIICSIPNTLVQRTFLIPKRNDQTPLCGFPSKHDTVSLSQKVLYFMTPEALLMYSIPLPMKPILSQLNPLNSYTLYFPKMHFNIILLSIPVSPTQSFASRIFCYQNLISQPWQNWRSTDIKRAEHISIKIWQFNKTNCGVRRMRDSALF